MCKVKKFLRLILVAGVCFACVLGIGYFAPALKQNTETSVSPKGLIRQITEQYMPSVAVEGFSKYDEYLAETVKKALQVYIPSEEITVVVQSDAVLRQDNIVQKEIIQDSGVVRSEHTEQHGNGVVVQDKVFDYSTKTTKSHLLFYDVKKINLLVFLAQTEQTEALIKNPQHIEELIHSASGFNQERGDMLKIVSVPTLTARDGFVNQLSIQMRQIIAIILICFLCIFLCAGMLIPWIIKNFYRKKPIQSVSSKEISDLYRYQIIGHMEDNLILKAQSLCAAMPEAAVNILRNRMAEETKQINRNDLFSPAQKAAIVLLCMGEKIIKQLFKYMTDSEIFSLSRLMASLGHVKAVDIQPVLLSFCQSMNAPQDIRQTKPLVENLIRNTLPADKAESLLYEMKITTKGKKVWDRLDKISTPQLSAFLAGEYPQTAAIILYHLTTEKAAAVLSEMDEQMGTRILMRLSALQYMNPDNVHRIELNLEKQIEMLMVKPKDIGAQKASAILSLLDKKTQGRYMTSMEHLAPQTAGVLAKHVLNFDDLAYWTANDLTVLMKYVDVKTLVLALSDAHPTTKQAFSRVMSPQKWGDILKKINKLPTGKLQEIDVSQRAIIQIAHQLIESKKCKGRMI